MKAKMPRIGKTMTTSNVVDLNNYRAQRSASVARVTAMASHPAARAAQLNRQRAQVQLRADRSARVGISIIAVSLIVFYVHTAIDGRTDVLNSFVAATFALGAATILGGARVCRHALSRLNHTDAS